MFTRILEGKALTLGLAGIIVGVFVSTISAQEGIARKSTDAAISSCSSCSDMEEPAGYAATRISEPVVRDPWIEKLHAERKVGNMAISHQMEMEAWHPQTTGEAACGTVVRPSTTIGGKGDLKQALSGEPVNNAKTALEQTAFGNDVKVRGVNYSTAEYYIDMTSDSQGNFYVVWEDTHLDHDYLQVYMSSDGGESWTGFGYVINPDHSLLSPSIAVGEDASGGGTLLLAYTVSVIGDIDYPEVATCPLPPEPRYFTVHSVPIYSTWEEYRDPVIVTDSFKYKPWYAYMTCEGIYHQGSGNVNICTWRSTDKGVTWKDQYVAFGNFDDMRWFDPDITFGTTKNRVLLVTHNYDLASIYTMASDTFGASWNSEVMFCGLPSAVISSRPKIAAAFSCDNVMVCCKKYSAVNDSFVIGQGYSQDAGDTWGTLFNMNGSCGFEEHTPSLTANERGNSWHLTWTSTEEHAILYNKRPQDLSTTWDNTPLVVNDTCTASTDFYPSIKGIASNWETDEACISWSDNREGGLDLDCYVDRTNNVGLMTDRTAIVDELGGSIYLFIRSGAENAYRNYAIFGSATGTSPGTPLPGGLATLPLNWDIITDIVLGNANVSPMFMNFIGKTDAQGEATAILNFPPVPGFAGVELYFAYAHNKPCDFASNAIAIRILEP